MKTLTSAAAALAVAALLAGSAHAAAAQRAEFPALVSDVNADPAVRMVLHAGDVKSG